MEFSEKLLLLRRKLGLTQVEMSKLVGVSSNYVSVLEKGDPTKPPSDIVRNHVDLLWKAADAGLLTEESAAKIQDEKGNPLKGTSGVKEDPLPYRVHGMRKVPIVSWAHAGDATSYEELPTHWQNSITSECRDPHAFAVTLEGDSMRATIPGVSFEPGDIIIAQPSEQAYSGGFVIAKFTNDGIIFRRFEAAGDRIRMIPLNERYPVTDHARSEFHWIYPVYGRVTHLSNR
ncbi:S24 family peptidase [Luteolibacter sp. SL250]|uniref:S24 family peptidase n=1 Tax=Luteolibacter sp. SL250 TaxID=2995170 RepID=UPI00226E8097|nr:S24 family peptidase [Luteolibacter sp. SL250]WAC18865.1 S24 family peptidase [Luteolibacter sp. SL250]